MRQLLHLILLAVAALVASAEPEDDGFELRQLTEDNFRSSTSQGLWLVEHFSPRCSHCRAFAPTWTELARDKQHLERLSGFHMAQVNCIAQGDLCNSNGIKFYPQLMMYSDGQLLSQYTGDRTYNDISTWIDEQSTLYARGQLLAGDQHEEQVLSSGFGRPNPEGKVLEVDEAGLDVLIGNGPVLVDFFAPWCGHCKKLKPIYDQVADGLKNKLNVASVDCEANKAFCRRQEVMGYPTIRLFHKGVRKEYTGSRTASAMKQFALKSAEQTTMQLIKYEDFDEIARTDEALFLYLQNFDTAVEDLELVKSALEPLLNTVPAYTSSDPLLYRNLSIANPPPTSVLLAFSAPSRTPVGTLAFPASREDVERFIAVHRFPTLSQLSSGNYADLMKSENKAIVVLGAVHRGDEGDKERRELAAIARAWKRGGRRFSQPVWFVWVEGEKWASWLKQAYGIKKSALPAVVVIDTELSEYYDTTIEGTSLVFEGASIFSVLEGVYQHFLRPKISESTFEWGSRSATMTLITLGQASMEHPLLALVTLVGAVAVFVFLLQRCLGRDPRENGHHSGTRLD